MYMIMSTCTLEKPGPHSSWIKISYEGRVPVQGFEQQPCIQVWFGKVSGTASARHPFLRMSYFKDVLFQGSSLQLKCCCSFASSWSKERLQKHEKSAFGKSKKSIWKSKKHFLEPKNSNRIFSNKNQLWSNFSKSIWKEGSLLIGINIRCSGYMVMTWERRGNDMVVAW